MIVYKSKMGQDYQLVNGNSMLETVRDCNEWLRQHNLEARISKATFELNTNGKKVQGTFPVYSLLNIDSGAQYRLDAWVGVHIGFFTENPGIIIEGVCNKLQVPYPPMSWSLFQYC